MRLIDVHTHLQLAAFDADRDAAVRRALDAGVWVINGGTSTGTSEKAIALAERFPEGVYATVGIHPDHTGPSDHFDSGEFSGDDEAKALVAHGESFDATRFNTFLQSKKVVGIGECGLDYAPSTDAAAKERQEKVFREHIEFARGANLPLVIHCRNAFDDLLRILGDYDLGDAAGAIHFFSGTPAHAKALAGMGFSFTFGGVITFARSYDEVIREIPFERILLETDAPYVSPVPYRGKRNEPAYLVEVAKKMSEIRGVPLEEIALRTFENATALFKLNA